MSQIQNLSLAGLFSSLLVFSGISQVNVFSEDFQNGIPSNWIIRNLDGLTPAAAVSEYTAAWISKADIDSSLNLTASSTSFFAPAGTANRWLISPAITLGTFGNSVSWKARSHDPSFPDSYLVLASKTDTEIASFTDTIGFVFNENAEWTIRTGIFKSSSFNNQMVYIAFVLQTEDGFKLYIDDVNVEKESSVGLENLATILINIETEEYGLFHLKSEVQILESKVYNSAGQLILTTKDTTIDLRQENSGLYFLHIKTANGMINRKLTNF